MRLVALLSLIGGSVWVGRDGPNVLAGAVMIVATVLVLIQAAKRCRDCGWPGALALLGVIPGVGLGALLVIAMVPSRA